MWNTWTTGGPKGARFNRPKSGWFDAISFDDWFRTIVLPWAQQKEGKRLLLVITCLAIFQLMYLVCLFGSK